MIPLLPLIVLLPFFFIIPIFLLPEQRAFNIALVAAIVLVLMVIAAAYIGNSQNFSLVSFQVDYIQSLGISFDLELTQYSTIFISMTAVVLLASAIVAKSFIKESWRIYNTLFLLTAGSSLGLFLSGNLFLFYIFWEISEISMFFIIYIFGGFDRRYAAFKFLIYSIAASLLLLLGIMVIYASIPAHSFDIMTIAATAGNMTQQTQFLAMVLLALAFLIKIPAFPFHNWLPDAHTEAPTTGSMMLAGILLKFGGYGLLLMFLLLPIASLYSLQLAFLFGFSALYSAFVVLRQSHLKRMIAYTSIVDMGIAALGIVSLNKFGVAGGLYAMLSHGIAISFLFLLAGTIDETYGTMLLSRLKGIVRNAPLLAYGFVLGTFMLIGIPLSSGFISDLLVFIGSFQAYGLFGLVPLIAILLIGAFFFLVSENSFFNSAKAIDLYEAPDPEVKIALLFLVLSTLLLGLFPSLLLGPFAI